MRRLLRQRCLGGATHPNGCEASQFCSAHLRATHSDVCRAAALGTKRILTGLVWPSTRMHLPRDHREGVTGRGAPSTRTTFSPARTRKACIRQPAATLPAGTGRRVPRAPPSLAITTARASRAHEFLELVGHGSRGCSQDLLKASAAQACSIASSRIEATGLIREWAATCSRGSHAAFATYGRHLGARLTALCHWRG
jgi:hypothetical protein